MRTPLTKEMVENLCREHAAPVELLRAAVPEGVDIDDPQDVKAFFSSAPEEADERKAQIDAAALVRHLGALGGFAKSWNEKYGGTRETESYTLALFSRPLLSAKGGLAYRVDWIEKRTGRVGLNLFAHEVEALRFFYEAEDSGIFSESLGFDEEFGG